MVALDATLLVLRREEATLSPPSTVFPLPRALVDDGFFGGQPRFFEGGIGPAESLPSIDSFLFWLFGGTGVRPILVDIALDETLSSSSPFVTLTRATRRVTLPTK